MNTSVLVVLCASILIGVAGAANTSDTAASLNERINQATGELQEKVTQRIAEENLTPENIQQNLNTSREELRQKASERINQNLNLTSEELQERAKEELKTRINETTQQPGFEAAFALVCLFAIACLFRRNR